MKTCTRCGLSKPIADFYKNPQKKDGHLSHCKVCHRQRYPVNPNNRSNLLRHKYGIDASVRDAMASNQGNKCKICNLVVPLNVDHDHKSGRVRGLLCLHCNSLIGFAKDDTNILKQAIVYLEEDT